MKLKVPSLGMLVSLSGAMVCCLFGSNLNAATFTWSAPVPLNGLTASQILTSTNTPGTIVGAVAFGSAAPVTVTLATNQAPIVFGSYQDPTVAKVSSPTPIYYGNGSWSGTSGNANFDSIINAYEFSNTNQITLINLVPGATYSVQLFAVYDYNGITVSFQNPTNSTNISSTYAEASNNYIVGTFTAPASTNGLTSVTIQENAPLGAATISALVLRAVSFTPAIKFTQQPTNSSYVDLGSNATYSAMATGPTPLLPQWQSGPAAGPYTNLPSSSHYSGVNTYSLTINGVTGADASLVYTLKLTSGTNSSNSATASLSTFGTAGATNTVAATNGSGPVNSAIYSTYLAGGGVVQMGAGTCTGSVLMYPNVTLRGAGISNTVILGTLTEAQYGNTEYSEGFSIYGGVNASQYTEGGTPGAGIFFGDYAGDDHFQWYKNIEVEGTDIAMQLIGVNGITLINCNFHDSGLGYSHSIYFTGDYGITMNNCFSSWALAGDGVHNDFAGNLASYSYTQCDYSGNIGYGLLVQADSSQPSLNMYGCTIQFNGQSGGAGNGLDCNSTGAIVSSRIDWNNGYGFNDNSTGTEIMAACTVIGNTQQYYSYGGVADIIMGVNQFVYDAAMADAIAGPNNTGDWVNQYNGYGGGGTEGNVAFINGSHPVNGSISWSAVGAPTNGSYVIHCFYANGSSNTLAMPMTVNGAYVGTQLFPPTGSWSTFANNAGIAANLTSSNNRVALSVLSPGLGAPVLQALYVPTTVPSSPGTPTGLTATANTNAPQSSMVSWITLNWNPVSQATCYNIYRNGLPIAKNVPGTSFTDKHVLGAGSSESYKVTAVNQSGEGSAASVTGISRQATPASCTATGGASLITVSCPATPGATSYTFARSTTSGGPYSTLGTTTNTSYNDTSVTVGTTYYYIVTASSATSQSFPSTQGSGSAYAPYSGSPVLVDVDLGSGATQSGAAVLGTNSNHWNAITGTTTTIVNSAGTTLSGVGLSLGDSGVFTDTGGTAMDSGTTALMQDYAYGNGASVTLNLTGLTNYRGANFTLVVYAAGDNAGQGASLSMSGATGGNSGSVLSTSAASRKVSVGNGVAYQTFTGTLNNGTLTINASVLSGQSFTVLNGIQLYLTHP